MAADMIGQWALFREIVWRGFRCWWGMRWSLEDVQRVLGHTDLRTTQIYAHLAPSAVAGTAARAQEAFALRRHAAAEGVGLRRHAAVTPKTTIRPSARNLGRVRQDSNLRPTAPEAVALSS